MGAAVSASSPGGDAEYFTFERTNMVGPSLRNYLEGEPQPSAFCRGFLCRFEHGDKPRVWQGQCIGWSSDRGCAIHAWHYGK